MYRRNALRLSAAPPLSRRSGDRRPVGPNLEIWTSEGQALRQDLQILAQPGGNLQIPVVLSRRSGDRHPVGPNLEIWTSEAQTLRQDLQILAQPGGNLHIPEFPVKD